MELTKAFQGEPVIGARSQANPDVRRRGDAESELFFEEMGQDGYDRRWVGWIDASSVPCGATHLLLVQCGAYVGVIFPDGVHRNYDGIPQAVRTQSVQST